MSRSAAIGLKETRSWTDRGWRDGRGPERPPGGGGPAGRRSVSTLMGSHQDTSDRSSTWSVRCASMRPRLRLPFLTSVLMVSGLAGTTLAGTTPAGATERAAPAPPTTPVRVIEVQGPIDRPLLAFLEERLAEAERAGAIVVLQLNTPGMLGQNGLALADRVAHLEVPVLSWVGPVLAAHAGVLARRGRTGLADGSPPSGGRPSSGDGVRGASDTDRRVARAARSTRRRSRCARATAGGSRGLGCKGCPCRNVHRP